MDSIEDYLADPAVIDRLRGQLQNCVNLLHRMKRHGSASDAQIADNAIESANKALYETLITNKPYTLPQQRRGEAMNNLIERLAKDAGYIIDTESNPWTEIHTPPPYSFSGPDDQMKYLTRFADLVAEECAKAIRELFSKPAESLNPEKRHTEKQGDDRDETPT